MEIHYSKAKAQTLAVVEQGDLSPIPTLYALPFKTKVLMQAALCRGLELAEATAAEITADRFVAAFVLSRALIETGAVAYDTFRRVEALLEAPTSQSLADFNSFLTKASWGAKSLRWRGEKFAPSPEGEPPRPGPTDKDLESINVLTTIQRVAKEAPWIWEWYEDLSECAHPNSAGMVNCYAKIRPERSDVSFVNPALGRLRNEMASYPIHSIGAGLSLISVGNQKFEERIAEFVRVTEENLFATGKWPKGQPYRWGNEA